MADFVYSAFDFVDIMFLIIFGVIVSILQIYLATAIHELGCFVFGKLAGYSFVSFKMLMWVWFKEGGEIKSTKSNMIVTAQCSMSPSKYSAEDIDKYKIVWYNLSGGIFNLIFAFVWCIGLILIRSVATAIGGGYLSTRLMIVFITCIVANIIIAIVNLAPIHFFGTPTPGCNVINALKSKEAKRGLYIMSFIDNELSKGKRYRDFAPELFEVSDNVDLNNYLVAGLVILEACRLRDIGEYEKSFEQFSRLESKQLPAMYSNTVKLELLYYHTVHNLNIEKAKAIYNDNSIQAVFQQVKLSQIDDYAWVLAAYEYFVLNDRESALRIIEQAQKNIETLPNIGVRIMYKELLDKVAERIFTCRGGYHPPAVANKSNINQIL